MSRGVFIKCSLVVLITIGLSCGKKDKVVEPEQPTVSSFEATSDANGEVVIDMGEQGAFRTRLRDALTEEPIEAAKCIAMIKSDEDSIVYVVLADDELYQPAFFVRSKDQTLFVAARVADPLNFWDDVFRWIGGSDPVPGIHGVWNIPLWAWQELLCYRQLGATEQIQDMHVGNIAEEIGGIAIHGVALLAAAFPPTAPVAVVLTAYTYVSSVYNLLEEIQLIVYQSQGYCLWQEVQLIRLWGICEGQFVLGLPIIEPVDDSPAPECTIHENEGVINGYVRDASSGVGIPSAIISVNGITTTSNTSGWYEISDLPQNRQLPISARAAGFHPYFDHAIIWGSDPLRRDITLDPALASGQFRFVLTWGSDPRDLDSHMWVPLGGGQYYHVYFANRGDLDDPPYAELDVDDVNGFGPETITLLPQYSGLYDYAVYEYSGDGTLATSGAVVNIYDGNDLMHSLDVPTDYCEDYWWWYVGYLNPMNGTFTIINELRSNPPRSFSADRTEK